MTQQQLRLAAPQAPGAAAHEQLEDYEHDCQCPKAAEGEHSESCHRVRQLTPQLKETIADQVFLGMGTLELARLHNLEPRYVRTVISSAPVRRRVAQRRDQVMAQASRAYFRFLMYADTLAEAQVRDALDPTSPNNYKARVYILDQVMPKRTASVGETTVNLQVNNQVLTELTEAVTGAREAREREVFGSPALVEGKKALPKIVSGDE